MSEQSLHKSTKIALISLPKNHLKPIFDLQTTLIILSMN